MTIKLTYQNVRFTDNALSLSVSDGGSFELDAAHPIKIYDVFGDGMTFSSVSISTQLFAMGNITTPKSYGGEIDLPIAYSGDSGPTIEMTTATEGEEIWASWSIPGGYGGAALVQGVPLVLTNYTPR